MVRPTVRGWATLSRTTDRERSVFCSGCGADNPAGKRFCGDCGSPLAAACAACGAINPPDKRFCGDCGSPLSVAAMPSREAPPAGSVARPDDGGQGPVAERRFVTVLFADLVGFTPFSEERDAEEVRETLTRYFAIAREVIELYGGRVEKFIGDAVMALWGAPTAREDDAERAVRAALELVDKVHGLAPGIQARAGVLTGEAAVTIGAINEGLVAGDLVNTAARIQAVAPHGGVLVGEATMRASSSSIVFEPAGDQVLKGKAEPVPTWRATRVVAQRGGQGRSDLPEPPFTGRDEELRLLKELLATSGRDGRARLVSILGPAGIGKSRLAWELEKYIDGITGDVYWHRGRSPSYGEGITFWALGEMVRRRAGLAEEEDAATTRSRIAATVVDYVDDEQDRAWIEPALLALLGVEPAPPGGRDVLFAAWRLFFEHIARRGPTVLLFEDLHWADSGLLDFVEYLLEWSKGAPLLVVALARPELLERRPDWGAGIRQHTRLALEPLAESAMRELLEGFVPGLPEHAVRAILDRADGVPLYAVETVRALVADGRLEPTGDGYQPVGDLGELTIPDTLRSLIAARLDTLDPDDRSLVADAAVLGQVFTIAGTAALSGRDPADIDARLRRLARRELFDLEVDPRSPERGQYRFVQSLIREVAYGTLARRDRRSRHVAAARFYESLGEDALAGALAMHYVSAHAASEPGPEADAVAIQARLALGGAADRAASLGGHDQAVRYLRSALEITSEPSERAALLLRAARSSNTMARHADAEELARQAIEAASQAADASLSGRANELLAEILVDTGSPQAGAEVLERALAAGLDDTPDEVRAAMLGTYSRTLMRSNRPQEAIAAADIALDLAEHLRLELVLAETLNNKGSSLTYLGRNVEGEALLQAAAEVAHRGGLVNAEIRALSNLSARNDRPEEALRWAKEARELALRIGNRSLANWATENVRYAHYILADDWDRAQEPRGFDEDATRPMDMSPLDEVRMLSIIGLVRTARGDAVEGVIGRLEELAPQASDEFAAHAVEMVRAEQDLAGGDYAGAVRNSLAASAHPTIGAQFMATAAHAVLWARDLDAAREAQATFEANPASDDFVAATRLALAAVVAILEGRHADAQGPLFESLATWRMSGGRWHTARHLLDVVLALGPDDPASVEAAREARETFELVGARPYLERLDALMGSATRPAAEPVASA
jgi:class 3 adenylate cyclase/tetratricopeptide (TPR) repeat protein